MCWLPGRRRRPPATSRFRHSRAMKKLPSCSSARTTMASRAAQRQTASESIAIKAVATDSPAVARRQHLFGWDRATACVRDLARRGEGPRWSGGHVRMAAIPRATIPPLSRSELVSMGAPRSPLKIAQASRASRRAGGGLRGAWTRVIQDEMAPRSRCRGSAGRPIDTMFTMSTGLPPHLAEQMPSRRQWRRPEVRRRVSL